MKINTRAGFLKVITGDIPSEGIASRSNGKNGDMAMQHDFRSIYATLLTNWFEPPRSKADKILFGKFPTLEWINHNRKNAVNNMPFHEYL
jgi:uncharacterized protein (DUF1501 family)